MNPIPWYHSPVYVSAVVSIISQMLVLVGKQDFVSVDVLTSNVEALFQIIALIAGLITLWKRQTSTLQPLTLTKASAEQKSQSPMLIGLLAILLSIAVMSGCANNPQVAVLDLACNTPSDYRVERCAKALGESYEVYQRRIIDLNAGAGTPDDAKRALRSVDEAAAPVILAMLGATASYMEVRDELAAGATTEEQLAIANQNLQKWVDLALARINDIRRALGEDV